MVTFMPEENPDKQKNFMIKHQAETAGVAGEKVLKLFGSIDHLFLLSDDPKAMEENNQAYEKLLADTMAILTECKVGLTNYNFVFGGIKSIITALEQHFKNHSENLQKEISSRVIGAKNPFDNKYDSNHATHEDLIQTILRLREEQGNVPGAEDYFTLVPKEPETPQEGSIPSPINLEDLNK